MKRDRMFGAQLAKILINQESSAKQTSSQQSSASFDIEAIAIENRMKCSKKTSSAITAFENIVEQCSSGFISKLNHDYKRAFARSIMMLGLAENNHNAQVNLLKEKFVDVMLQQCLQEESYIKGLKTLQLELERKEQLLEDLKFEKLNVPAKVPELALKLSFLIKIVIL